jgi:hypothetical protein
MNHINVSVTVDQTTTETTTRLESFFAHYAPQAEMTFTLRAPFDIAALRVGLTLARDVTARVAPLGTDSHAYTIAWQPVEPGPFPAFAGTIFISPSDDEPSETIVTLDGHYHPPLGVAGDVFDALVGKHIAQASASDLLERISLYIDANEPVAVAATTLA